MAHHVEDTLSVNVPAKEVWEVLEDFSSIERFASTVETSPIVNDKS